MKAPQSPPAASSSNKSNNNNNNNNDIISTERDHLLRHSHSCNYSSSSGNQLRERRSSKNSSPINAPPTTITSKTVNSKALRYSDMNYPNPNSHPTITGDDSQRSFPQLPVHHNSSGGSSAGGGGGLGSGLPPPPPPQQSSHVNSNSRSYSEQDRYATGNSTTANANTNTNDMQEYYNDRATSLLSSVGNDGRGRRKRLPKNGQSQHARETPLIIPVSPEVRAVRVSALAVFDPLTYTWLICTIGFGVSSALAMAKWTGLLSNLAYWFILLPCWMSHGGLFTCQIYSVKALSTFITEANRKRQRQNSTDHLDRTEYLPLLQRSLKFGLKSGAISFAILVSEILLYVRLRKGSPSLAVALIPFWIIVVYGILDGIICKTQNITRVISWCLLGTSMILLVLRMDYYESYELDWQMVASPMIVFLAIVISSLVYILYGNRVGYFQLTESQCTAAIFYSLGSVGGFALIFLFLFSHLARPNALELRVVMTFLAPLTVVFFGLGAWAISRDEFDRLLQHGGQAAVHPMRLRLERKGWNATESKGVTIIPMFGEVRYEPLDPSQKNKVVELCSCCACFPYEEEEEPYVMDTEEPPEHPYMADTTQGLGKDGTSASISSGIKRSKREIA